MKKLHYILISFIAIWAMQGCAEDLGTVKPMVNDGTAPGVVTGMSVENKSGVAKLVYKIPTDNDLLYIKAEYEIRPGVKREVRSSKYNDWLLVDGFGQAKEYTIKLYAVDIGENVSEPVTITVNPTSPPVVEVAKALSLFDAFGGAGIMFNNPNESELAIVVLQKDKLQPVKTVYTKDKSGGFSVRGFTESVVLGYYIRDKYGNISDTTFTPVNPLPEMQLDRTKMFSKIPTAALDIYSQDVLPHVTWRDPNTLFNGKTSVDGDGPALGYHTASTPADGMRAFPFWITMDLGITKKLSRFKVFQRAAAAAPGYFGGVNMKRFEVWGSTNPAPDGSMDGWVKLGTFESKKPSGQASTNTADDIAYAKAGEEYVLDATVPPVRYFRIKALENWGGGGAPDAISIMELQFWGGIN